MKKMVAMAALVLLVGGSLAKVPDNTIIEMLPGDLNFDFDPGQVYSLTTKDIYETLVTYKGKSIIELQGLLATNWTISPDGKIYTFTLRKGVKFHSGNELSCADTEYTLRRNLVINNSDSGNWFISETLLGTKVNAKSDPSITWTRIAGAVKCNAQGQLVLTLPARDPATLYKLAYTSQAIVDSKHAISIGEWDGTEKTWKDWVGRDLHQSELHKKPSGTGAYTIARREPKILALKAFDGYWGGKPKIENVIFQQVEERATRIEALKNGDADFVNVGVRSLLSQLRGVPGVKILDDLPNNTSTVISMNQNIKDPNMLGSGKLDGKGIPANFFSDINVRKGFAHAYDHERLIREVNEGKATRRTMALPDSFLGYDPKVKLYNFDLDLAAQYFKKAWGGQVWENGFVVKLVMAPNNLGRDIAIEMLRTNLEKINPKFKLEVVNKSSSEMANEDLKGFYPMVFVFWSPDYADPDNFIFPFYHSKGFYNGLFNFKDSLLDSLVEQGRQTTDPAKRKLFYSQVGQRGYELSPFIVLSAGLGFRASNEQIKGVEENNNPMLGFFYKDLYKTPRP